MKLNLVNMFPLLGCLIMLDGTTALAQDDNTEFTLSAGMDFTSGRYGGDVDIDDFYLPLTATANRARISYRLTVPYLSVRGPEGTLIYDPGAEPQPGSGDIVTESGLGDIIGSVTVYDVFSNPRLGLAIDLTGKIKFGTADEEKGLGTGQNDYSVQADFYKFAEKLTILGSVGYKFRGDPTDVELNDVVTASLGGIYKFTPDVRGGLVFDYRESSISGNDAVQELTGFVSRRINEHWQLQFYALAGFSDSSPDMGVGFLMKRELRPQK
jgi:hypothetical protein